MRHFKYTLYIFWHKWYVMIECFKCGLIWRGLIHDWSKLLPTEWIPYANFFYGKGAKPRIDKTGYYKPTDTGDAAFDFAWLLHLKRNRHHWQWWMLPEEEDGVKILPIQEPYLTEMICDWIGAGKAQGHFSPPNDPMQETRNWWKTNNHKMQLHPSSRTEIEQRLYSSLRLLDKISPECEGELTRKSPATSDCCGSPMKVEGMGDFQKSDVCTQYYVCSKCEKPCNQKCTDSVKKCIESSPPEECTSTSTRHASDSSVGATCDEATSQNDASYSSGEGDSVREALHTFATTYRAESKESRKECIDKVIEEIGLKEYAEAVEEVRIERVWAMPNKWTFTIPPIKKLLKEEIIDGMWCDPFSGENSMAQVKNDLNPKISSEFHMDALEFLKTRNDNEFDGVLFDPPYSITQAKQCYDSFGIEKLKINVSSMKYWAECKNEITRVVKPDGKVICFGWNSMGLGKNRGFEMYRILLVPHGGPKNDTIITCERNDRPSSL